MPVLAGAAFVSVLPERAELVSLLVGAPHRGRGVATALVAAAEAAARKAGAPVLAALFRDDLAAAPAVRRLLAHAGFTEPEPRLRHLRARITPATLAHSRMEAWRIPDGYAAVPWRDLPASAFDGLRARLDTGTIPAALSPFQLPGLVDADVSTALCAADGTVAGFSLLHRTRPDVLQYSAVWVEPALRRLARGVSPALMAATLRRHATLAPEADLFAVIEAGNAATLRFVEHIVGPSPHLTLAWWLAAFKPL